ncbi:MAG: SBBP repeat-containing protein [Bacteroidetes bacterium]|nr:SBBP repeat-containing protein [Bacteroidota bacterium]
MIVFKKWGLLVLFFLLANFHYKLIAQCGLDVYLANDQSGSVDGIENLQGRHFIVNLMDNMQPWGNNDNESRLAIAQWDHGYGGFNFPLAGINYTTNLSDVIAYQNSPRFLSGGTDPYNALLQAYNAINITPIAGRKANKVIILMTDAACSQIQNNIVDLATQIKNEGIYLMVLAIDDAQSCTILQDENIASPGGYFSAINYAELEAKAILYVQDIINSACVDPPPPSFDLVINPTSYTAINCNIGAGTYKINYTITNRGRLAFNDNMVVSFYNGDPTLPSSNLVSIQNIGMLNLSPGAVYNGTLTNTALGSSSQLFIIVNFNGNLLGNNPPLPRDLVGRLNIIGEQNTRNNISTGINWVKDATCPPNAIINIAVSNGGIGCNNLVTYNVTTCNNGDADAFVKEELPFVNASFVLKSDTIASNSTTIKRLWATYYGGSLPDSGYSVALDLNGNIFVTGITKSNNNIATVGASQTTFGGGKMDAFLVKFNSAGIRQWATYIGGNSTDYAYDLTTDASGNIYVAGYTESDNNIATAGAFQQTIVADEEAFLVKYNSAGNKLWGTYYGGDNTDFGQGVVTDNVGNVYLAGLTEGSTNLATVGAHQSVYNDNNDAFLVKFNPSGNRIWATYYGGLDEELETKVAADNTGNVYITGRTQSTSSIATAGAFLTSYSGDDDVYLVKFNSLGVRQWGTYYGGLNFEIEPVIATDLNGNVYLAGQTNSTNLMSTAGVVQTTLGGSDDGFLAKFNGAGVRQWGTYYGGTGLDGIKSVAVDPSGNIFISGQTNSNNAISTSGAHQTLNGGTQDAYLVKLNSNGIRQWASYFGDTGMDYGSGVKADALGNIYLVGHSNSTANISTTGTHQLIYGGNASDAFLAKFNEKDLGFFIPAHSCITNQYVYDVSATAPGTYNLSISAVVTKGLITDGTPIVLPDSNFSIGPINNLDGFNGAVHSEDNITVTGTTPICVIGDKVTTSVNIPSISGCGGGGNYVQANITINNTSGTIIFNSVLNLNLIGIGAKFAGEPYLISNNLSLAMANILNPSYPAIPYALYGKVGSQFLPIYQLHPGISTFKIDINLGTGIANLAIQIDSIPNIFNASTKSNIATDAQGVTILPIPTITGFSCPSFVTNGNNISFSGISTTNTTSLKWASSSVTNLVNNGTILNPSLIYTPTALDIARGYVVISLTAYNSAGCETLKSCQIPINGTLFDFGDAPIGYDLNKNTVPVAGSSTIFSGINLGTLPPSSEVFAKNSTTGIGDGIEEDGLIIPNCGASKPIINQQYSISIKTNNSTALKAYASGFIDFNHDGDFLDDSESVRNIIFVPPFSGTINSNLVFNVPNNLNSITTQYFIRLRISTDSNIIKRPYETSPQGEIEDFLYNVGQQSTTTNQIISICFGQSFTVGTHIYNTQGIKNDTLLSISGCDSIVITNLSILPLLSSSFAKTICSGQSYFFNGINRTATAIYKDTLVGSGSCDSVVTLNLTVSNVLSSSFAKTICSGQSYFFNGINQTTTGIYKDTLVGSGSCDSVVTLNLTVSNVLSSSFAKTICSGQSYFFNGINQTTTGIYKDTLVGSGSCDSVVTLNLTVSNVLSSSFAKTICSGQSYFFNGINRTATGIYKDTLVGSGSCDSVVTLNLTVSNVLSSSFAKTICSGQSYFFNGINQTTTGIYKDTLVGSGSCDSVVTLNLTVSNVLSSNFAKTICSGQSYFFNGINRTATGIYKDTLVGSGSCDSVVTLNLTVSNVLSSSFAKTICSGQSYFFNGINRTATGIYKDTLVGSGSCDSVVTLNLTVSNSLSSSFSETICSGQSYFFNGINQTTTGIYKDTLVGSGSCDSVVTLNLTVSNVLSSSFAKTICSGQSYFFNGINQTTTGIYKDTWWAVALAIRW